MVRQVDGGRCFHARYADGTEFLLDRRGDRVWARWPELLTCEDTATYLLGPISGFLLRLRGTPCLHASAIAVADRALALLGPAGAGKSTTAAAFAERGYAVLAEDVLPLSGKDGDVMAWPGYPGIRLWPDSVAALYGSEDAVLPLTPNWDKRGLDLVERGLPFRCAPQVLGAVYVLGERSRAPAAPFVEPVPAGEALMTLVANSYTNYLLDREMRAREFELLGTLVSRVPVRRVTPHADPDRLPRLCAAIMEDFALVGRAS
jgi:hypothetical protein